MAAKRHGPRKDPTLFAVGLTSTIAGGVGLHVGATLLMLSQRSCWLMCLDDEPGPRRVDGPMQDAGMVTSLVSVAALGAGIPLMVIGGKRVARDVAITPLAAAGAGASIAIAF